LDAFRSVFRKPFLQPAHVLAQFAFHYLCVYLCGADAGIPQDPVRLVLMNTAGNRNRDLNEPVSMGQRMVTGLLRLFLPPHADNEKAADYLRKEIGQNNVHLEWVVVRPDSLIDGEQVTEYVLHPSPTRSAMFNPGKTSRIQVAHFMARLILDDKLWDTWQGQMPVIYNDSKEVIT